MSSTTSTPSSEEHESTEIESKWFDRASFEDDVSTPWKFRGSKMSKRIVLNPAFPDQLKMFEQTWPLLPNLAMAYIALDYLSTGITTTCGSAIEAIEYISRCETFLVQGARHAGIPSWTNYMASIHEELVFAPDFTLWDKHTREIENLAKVVEEQTSIILDAYHGSNLRLPDEVRRGIYTRTNVIMDWSQQTYPLRESESYLRWKETTEVTPTNPTGIRMRKVRAGLPEFISNVPSIIESEPTHSFPKSTHNIFNLRAFCLQDDLTIWLINILIYLPCTIFQAISFARQSPTTSTSSDMLAASQMFLTQELSVFMIYILASKMESGISLGRRYQVFFALAHILPILAFAILKWYTGMSGLLSFVGTALTGYLQILLAVDIKKTRLP